LKIAEGATTLELLKHGQRGKREEVLWSETPLSEDISEGREKLRGSGRAWLDGRWAGICALAKVWGKRSPVKRLMV